jgi:hypothetical protein
MRSAAVMRKKVRFLFSIRHMSQMLVRSEAIDITVKSSTAKDGGRRVKGEKKRREDGG